MDSSDNTRTAPAGTPFHEAVFYNTAAAPSDTLLVLIPDFSADLPFGDPDGVVWSPIGGALPQAGDRALVAESTDGSWWVLAWWSDQQTDGSALEARVVALEAAEVSINGGSDTVVFSGSATSATKTVNHGLSGTPRAIEVWNADSPTVIDVHYVDGSKNSTSFQAVGRADDGAVTTGSITFFWIALL